MRDEDELEPQVRKVEVHVWLRNDHASGLLKLATQRGETLGTTIEYLWTMHRIVHGWRDR